MKTIVLPLFLLLSVFSFGQKETPCATDYFVQKQFKTHPGLRTEYSARQKETNSFIGAKRISSQKNSAIRIIPTVFHIIHNGGNENISKAQVLNQLQTLNDDFRRMNADTVNTPPPFKPLAADSQVEFRLAQIDPNGNCTDGIVRVQSPLTYNAGDNVKALSSWDNDKYLNVWVVASIYNWTGGGGTILGYAYYPGTAPQGADGCVVRSDYTGSIGTAAGGAGRTLTHEVGHYLDLIHIWGDASCGDDQVFDTPVAFGPNFGCPAFPHISCSNGPDGDMFTNYMDYTDDLCMNMFSWGQSLRMDATLAGYRAQLVSVSNLIATGTNGTPAVPCALVPDFYSDKRMLCVGDSIHFYDMSWNSDATSWTWIFNGGNPSFSNLQNPVVQYNSQGIYDVTLIAGNSTGSYSVIKQDWIMANPASSSIQLPYSESFESMVFPNADWQVENDSGFGWERTIVTGATGTASVYINNLSGNAQGKTDRFYTGTFDFSGISSPSATFKVAFAQTASSSSDQLKVYVTVNCGETWTLRYIKSGNSLATAAPATSGFIPAANEWRTETISMPSSTFGNKPNIKFRFDYVHDSGNNIFIDDINISGPVGINEFFSPEHVVMNVFPNPAESAAELTIYFPEPYFNAAVSIFQSDGRKIRDLFSGETAGGEMKFILPRLAEGVYIIKLTAGSAALYSKLFIR